MNAVTVTNISSRTTKTYDLRIQGAGVRPCQFSASGRRYLPERVSVQKQDGNVSSVTLRGPVLRKDGTAGANDHEEVLFGRKDWPAWLHSIVGGLA